MERRTGKIRGAFSRMHRALDGWMLARAPASRGPHMERRTGKIRGAFSRMHRALDGWMLARAPASPAQGLHHHGPRYFNFPFFCTMCGLEKLGIIVDHNCLERIGPIC